MVELAADYYLTNFQRILETVLDLYGDILTPDEMDFARGFHALSDDAKRCYVRLVSRVGPWFRVDKLTYKEISDLSGALAALRGIGFVRTTHDAWHDAVIAGICDPETSAALLAEWCALLTLDELKAFARAGRDDGAGKGGKPPSGVRKDELVQWVIGNAEVGALKSRFEERWSAVAPAHAELLELYLLLFFGNSAQDLTEFVLQDLGVVTYESYTIEKDFRVFPCRAALEDRLAVRAVRAAIEPRLAEGDLDAALVEVERLTDDARAWHASVRGRRARVCNELARALERAGRLDEALLLYRRSHLPPARERAARILAKLGHKDRATELALAMLSAPADETERIFALSHLKRSENAPAGRGRKGVEPECESVSLTLERNPRAAIEAQVLAALAREGVDAFYTENMLWNGLFGLAFWDVIFMPAPGAFAHPFQRAPLDMFSPGFARAREEAVTRRIAELRTGEFGPRRFLEVYESKCGLANAFVAWGDGAKEVYLRAAELIGPVQIAGVLERMVADPKRYGNGFPDLFVCPAEGRRAEFWEVKGPGDTLRPEQKSWIAVFQSLGVEVKVARVRWS